MGGVDSRLGPLLLLVLVLGVVACDSSAASSGGATSTGGSTSSGGASGVASAA